MYTVSQDHSSTKIEKSDEVLFRYLRLSFCFNDKFSFSADDVIKNVRNPYIRSIDLFTKRHRLVDNGGFTKFEVLYSGQNHVKSIKNQ